MSVRVFCENHDEYKAIYTQCRPLMDDRCPLCRISSLESENAALGKERDELRVAIAGKAFTSPRNSDWVGIAERMRSKETKVHGL